MGVFKIRDESEQLFPEFIKTNLSLRSVAEILEMQKGSQRQKWPGVVEGLGELTKEKLLNPLDLEDEAWKFDDEDTKSMAENFLGKEIDEVGVLAERIIDEAMERLSQESSKDSFPVSEWAKHLVASPVDNPIGDENSEKYYPAVRRAAEILTVAAFNDMNDLNGQLKFMYAAGGLELESDVSEIVRDLAFEVFERAKESINPLVNANSQEMRKKLGLNILSPAIRDQIAHARKQAICELAKNNPMLQTLLDAMDKKAKKGQ